jgi:hypothetical protein
VEAPVDRPGTICRLQRPQYYHMSSLTRHHQYTLTQSSKLSVPMRHFRGWTTTLHPNLIPLISPRLSMQASEEGKKLRQRSKLNKVRRPSFNSSSRSTHLTPAWYQIQKSTTSNLLSGGMSLPTHQANFLSTSISELLHHDANAILSDEIWQANSVVNPNTGSSLNYTQLRQGPDKDQWIRATANEIARLAQRRENGPTGTNTMFFIPHTAVP